MDNNLLQQDEPLRVSKYIKEDGTPCNLMVTIAASLVVSRRNNRSRVDRDFNMWKGKHVRNFKKFRKVRLCWLMEVVTKHDSA